RCWIIGMGMLLLVFVVFLLARDFIHAFHGSMFDLSRHELNVIFYCWMGLLKIFVFTFFFIPWLAIKSALGKPTES
ncbi:MAG: hypothetical protein N2C14_28765, partial [Planctomycetales bacterium]